MSDFSFEIPPLTAHLKPILDSYPLGGQILKELLQNAEDSGANVVKFFIDFTEYPSETLLHPELNKFQGPALLVYNNSQFDENDFKSIISIRQSQKNDKPLKIGKFGLGFKSVYHLTDLPSLVSGNDLIIFDPHEKYLRQHHAKNAMRFHYELGKENAYFENYSHQFEPYKNIELNPGQKIDFKNEFKGSLFRFPIRNKEAAQVSKLCSTYKEVDKIIYEDILESFFQDLNLILLFLRRIESIEIIEIKNGQQVLIASTTLDFDSSSQNLRQIRESFYDQLVASLSPEKTMDEETFNRDDLAYNFKITIKTMILDRNTNEYTITKDEYLMSSYVKFKSCSEALKNLAHKTSNFAACAAAYKLEKNFQDKFKQSRYFCFLPMPETIEKSGLPLHIHGSFGLRDDRRDFKWLSSDAKEDQAAKWNELMVSEVLNKVLIQLIDYAKDLIQNKNSDFDLNNFYYLLPDLSNIGLNWKDKHLKVFLNSLGENNLVLNRCWQWSNINQIYLTNKMDCKIEEFGQKNGLLSNNCFKDTIYNCFDPEKLSAISIPDHVLAIFESYNKLDNLNYINEELILNQMRKMFNFGSISGEQKADLLNYMIQSVSEVKMLDKIELLPLKNGKWSRFNEYSVFYFENSDLTEMFKGIDHLILDDKKLNKLSKYHLFNNLLKKNDETIISFDRDQFARLFEKSFKSEYSFEDIERVWRFVLAEFYDSLVPLEHLSLVPQKHQGKINFLKLKDNKSYIKYFIIDEQNEQLNKLKTFFEHHSNEKNGCLFFERLPQAMRNHPKIFNYFSNFNKDGLIDCLLALDGYCSKSEICIKNLIKNDMSSEQKEIVADCLNSVENVSRENFLSLAHKLPIFKAISKNNEFFTIEDGKSSFLNAQLDIQNLPIDPNLIIIDASYAEKLLSKLGLKKYKINNLIEISIDYHLTRKNFKAITAFLEWIMVNRFKKFDDVSIESFFQSSIAFKPIFTNNSNEPRFLRDIYDPKDKFVKNFVPEELQLNKDYLNDLFYPSFQPHLRRNIQFKVIEKYFQQLNSNETGLSQKDFFDKCKMVFDYMDTLENEEINRIIDLAAKYQWLPCDNFSNWSEAKFYKSTELWDSKFKNLIKHVEPIYLSELIPTKFKTKLSIISQSPNLEVVIRNLEFIVTNHESIDLNDLEAIYNYFQNCISISKYSADDLRQKLKSHFGSKFFIFDGINSFQNASNLIWKSEIADLSPYLTVLNLNTFLKKFQSLYTKVFGVVEKLNLVVLMDLLEKMKDGPKDSILIYSIYNLIEQKFQKELIESKDLKSKFLLPVLNLNNNFEFEKIEKCVYLVETDIQDTFNSNEIVYDEILSQKIDLLSQKGFKICCQKISTKFLRKLGVSSSIEKLMDVENMSIESFGQYEKITDRIKELLDGYKDGISIFKEAIQNADDAGATIVKICYDKRKNSLWKNPNKLLDRGLVKCQGESLIFYNDAVFTDNDFKNLIRLGAGTKKNLKEKVGKFGLGFNTFYNVTDLPCILSRDSLVLLDPNVKFMTNIIRNRGEPGKKINIKSVNQFVRTNYCDQFKPFENLFGCDIFSNDFFYNGTLIRLPLRTEPSEISSHIYNKDSEIKSLLSILINNAESLLLFTQSVCTVEFHVIPSEATGPDSKLLLKFEKKPELYLEKFPNPSLSNESESEFSSQTKILSACSKNSVSDLKSAFILCTTVELFDENFSYLCPKFKLDKRSGEHYWLTVSSYFSKYLIKNNSVFENFVPCVGCAVKLEKIESNYSIVDINGQTFCFLPLPIYSNLKFHVNAAFNISRDRLNFNENTKDDKVSDEKHKWNSYLVQPLVENLLLMINHSLNAVKLDNVAKFLSTMWPLEMKSSFFKDFEKKFYDTICLPNNGYRIFPTVLDQTNKFTCYDQSLFVDFDFEDEKIQSSALCCLKKIYQFNSLVVIPSKYLAIIKDKTNDASKFVNDFTLLKILVSNLSSLDLDDYIQLLKFYLLQKCFHLSNMTMYANLIKDEKCIPTCNGTFKFVNDLVDPNTNEYFKSLFSQEDDMFPCNKLIENNQISNKLSNLGMKKHFLDHETVIKLTEKIESCNDLTKARNLSEILSEYLHDYFFRSSNTNLDDLKENLDNVKWLFPVTKPESWLFPWFESNNRKYKPSELYNSREKKLIGSIAPLYREKYSNFMKNLNKDNMLNLVMEQFKFLKKHYESTEQPLSTFTQYFTEFCKYLQNNSTETEKTEKISIHQQQNVDNQIQIFKESLPQKWIFCENNSQKNKFLSLNSFAIQVQNPSEPDLLQFPKNLVDDHKKANFFKQMGLIDFFSLESLRSRIEILKNKFQDSPLGDSELDYCLKIVNEILYIDKNRKDSQYLDQMILDKQFYLPDENCVLRRIEDMCYEKSLSLLLAEHKIYPVHPEIPFKSFSIKSSRDKVLKTIGNQLCIDTELFGQKESLIDRIRDILSRYSSESTIFKELIQNADDAKATTVSFILDTRNLGSSCLPYEEMKNLQGPSICCYNNSIFSEQDLKGIISLSKGSKQKSMEKIGKFGIGFNSVYHLTDVPQFISNFSDFVLLDPSCKYYRSLNETNPGIKIKNAKMNLKNDLFSDVLSGFELNGFDLENATMFRFPLRKSHSDISTSTYDIQRAESLIRRFIDSSCHDVILFLKNIQEISFYVTDKDGNLEKMDEVKISHDRTDEFEREKNLYLYSDLESVPKKTCFYKTKIASFKCQKEYLVFEQFGFDPEFDHEGHINKLKCRPKDKYFPNASLAFDTALIQVENFKKEFSIYNFLPLESEKSPLKCHINAYWALMEENRTRLFDFGMRTKNAEKETAEWLTNWNLGLINLIILPLFLEMVRTLKNMHNEKPERFLEFYFSIFPDVNLYTDSMKSYFEKFCTRFYQKIWDQEFIPILKNEIKWFKPSELYFSEKFEEFIRNSYIYCLNQSRDNLCDIIWKANIKICRQNNLIKIFKQNANLDLKLITPKILVDGLRNYRDAIDGIKIQDSIFSNIQNLELILRYCLNENNIDLENCPLLLRQDEILTNFSSKKKIVKRQFNGCGHLFFHINFFNIVPNNKIWFRDININDLIELIPSILDKSIYFIQGSMEYPEFSLSKNSRLVDQVVKLIDESIGNVNNLNKNEILVKLKPIEDWAIIKVNQKSRKFLMPIKEVERIVKNFSFLLFKDTDLPVYDSRNAENNFLTKIIQDLNKIDDLITFIQNQKNLYDKIFSWANKEEFFRLFNDKIKITYRSKLQKICHFNLEESGPHTQSSVKRFLKSLPIYEDIFGQVDSIENSEVILLDFSDLPTVSKIKEFFGQNLKSESSYLSEFLDFANHRSNCRIIKKNYEKIFDFLDIEPTKFENLYYIFFEWVLSIPDLKLLEYHIDNLLSLGVENLKKDHNLWNLLKEMKFIKIEKKFYSVDQVYDPENELFRKSLSEFLLPDSLNTNDWRSLLDKLGLRQNCNAEDCILIARTLRDKYLKKKLSLDQLKDVCRLFFEKIDKIQTDDIINSIKDIKFIPILNNDNILEYIKPSNSIHGDLICLNDSICGENQKFSWLIKPVLPYYIKELGNNSGIVVDLSNEILVENFLQLLVLLSENKSSKLKNMTRYRMSELKRLMMSYYDKFQSIEDDTILDQLKDKNLILVERKTDKSFDLCRTNRVIKDLIFADQIDDFFYKFPEEYAKNWDFFQQLGANENVPFSLCQQVLQHYYSTENSLSKEAFNNVLVVIKHLILENSIDQDNLPKLDLYFPNSSREMKHLNTLYYMDKPSHESIIKNSNDIKSIVLFDIKELINHYHDTYHSNSGENMEQNCSKKRRKYKSIMFKQVSWLSIFENFEYFKTKRDLAPKRLSDKLIEKLKVKGDGEERVLDENLMIKLHSDQLFESLIECFEAVNDEEMFDIDKQLIEDIKNCIRSISVYRMSDLVTQFYDFDNPNNFFTDTEKRVKIARIKDDDGKGINFMIRGDFNDELDIHFYLVETIVEEIKKLFVLKSYENMEAIKNCLGLRSYRFFYMVIKLLNNNDDSSQSEIINNYKSEFPMPIV